MRVGAAERHNPPLKNSGALRDAGGYLGAVVGRPLQAGLGTGGAAVLLVAVLVVALLVATGVSLATIGRALRAAEPGAAARQCHCGGAGLS